jgi:hypothetical protein
LSASPRDPAIAGLGLTELGKVYGPTAADFAGEAVRRAAADAGLALGDIDGLLLSSGTTGGVHLDLQRDLELTDLRLLSEMQAYGSTAGAMVQVASMAVRAGCWPPPGWPRPTTATRWPPAVTWRPTGRPASSSARSPSPSGSGPR